MSNFGEHAKTAAAVAGLVSLVYTAGGAFAGKADADELAETKTRASVLETQVEELNSKVDRILQILEDR